MTSDDGGTMVVPTQDAEWERRSWGPAILEAQMKRRSGFTLVEILIVVIILGILAAIVIPQFTEASNDARESSLRSDLQTTRSQIELYKVQHLEKLPSQKVDGTADTAANFLARMTGKTDQDGTLNAAGKYGLYFQSFPTNPFNNLNTVLFGTADTFTPDNTTGWYFNTADGKIFANDTMKDASNNFTHPTL
jgi:general secretion pathway protein G